MKIVNVYVEGPTPTYLDIAGRYRVALNLDQDPPHPMAIVRQASDRDRDTRVGVNPDGRLGRRLVEEARRAPEVVAARASPCLAARLLGPAILDALGIAADGVTKVELTIEAGRPATVRVTRLVNERRADGVMSLVAAFSQFDLVGRLVAEGEEAGA